MSEIIQAGKLCNRLSAPPTNTGCAWPCTVLGLEKTHLSGNIVRLLCRDQAISKLSPDTAILAAPSAQAALGEVGIAGVNGKIYRPTKGQDRRDRKSVVQGERAARR